MLEFWRKGSELHIQNGEWGNDLTCVEGAEMGTYCPLTPEEHLKRGYTQITFDEAAEMAMIAGYDLHELSQEE